MPIHVIIQNVRNERVRALQEPRRRPRGGTTLVGCLVTMTVIVLALAAGPVAGEELRSLGHPPVVPLEQAADVILVLKPHTAQSLHIPATIDRVVQGEIVRLDKGALPKMIVHTRNTLTAPLKAGVPVTLYLKEFKDGHGHYIIGVDSAPDGGQP